MHALGHGLMLFKIYHTRGSGAGLQANEEDPCPARIIADSIKKARMIFYNDPGVKAKGQKITRIIEV